MTAAQRLTDVITHHGEGAGWHRGERALKCVDLLVGDVVTLAEDGTVAHRLRVGTVAAAWRERTGGGLVVATERGFGLVGADGSLGWLGEAWSDPGVRMNDGACDPQGRFYCGSMAYDARAGAGTMWRLDPDRSVHRVADGFTIANGLVWSLDGSTVYHVDTPTGRIDGYAFDAEAGRFGERRTVAEVPGGDPDGMTIDAEGGLWVALWGGSAVHRYGTDGELTEVIDIGARQVTSCAFGGQDLDRLFVTTSRQGLDDGDDPAAGSVFVAEVGVRGVPLLAFGG
jgi:sugar lactone lactonase YvrE